ncbi:hypothetical protein [Aurantiacibacter rhizosphaerae]|uniref:Uncharacterized protein n=1 Tax=Aurantiacibacter rhizosphaerae TaxID=2691582 RepID=A0A844XDR8_9SPHN|nr:hypothetical protein [Aurantiacibacter rhizosphaerae]MWV27738.1 hypothetical protein [Aurantiacibacter rhizosphaerae]
MTAMLSAAGLVLTACDAGEADNIDADAPAEQISIADEPDLFNTGSAETPAETAMPLPNCPENAFCEGPLVVRADTLNLVPTGSTNASLNGTFSVENRSNEDLRVVLMDEYAVASLENGVNATSNPYRPSGLEECRQSGPDCFAANPGSFRTLAPGDSPAKVTASMRANFDAQMMPSMRDISSATVNFQLFSVSAAGDQRLHQVSLAGIPFQNQMAE